MTLCPEQGRDPTASVVRTRQVVVTNAAFEPPCVRPWARPS